VGFGGENKRVRGPVSEWEKEREREKRRVRDREKERERDPPRRAGEPCFEEGRKTEKELWRERERGKLRSKRQRQSTQERDRDREYNVTRTAHISTPWHTLTARLSLPIHVQHHHPCSSVENKILSG
jgi:hypothetical protein